MAGSVIRLSEFSTGSSLELRSRLETIAAVFKAIRAGELLSALPECPVARDHHNAALVLINVVESEVQALCSDLDDLYHAGE